MDVVDDLKASIQWLIENGTKTEDIVLVEASPDWPGELLFQPLDPARLTVFYERYKDWVSRYMVLNQLYNLTDFCQLLEKDGYSVHFAANTKDALRHFEYNQRPCGIEGLYPFQNFGLNVAMGRQFFFFNWAAGAGKSYCSSLAAAHLLSDDSAEVVMVFTLTKLKEDMLRRLRAAGVDAVINDGTKDRRRKLYGQRHQAYVMNYEKAWVDRELLEPLVRGRRVVWILDECHKVVTDDPRNRNKSRRAIQGLLDISSDVWVWPMSASVVNGNPLRYRDVYSIGRGHSNPLGTKEDFVGRYASEVKELEVTRKDGKGRFPMTIYTWNLPRLQEVRHRIADRTQAVRKTDPGVREQFKGIQTIPMDVQLNSEEWALIDVITKMAKEAKAKAAKKGEVLDKGPYYRMLRYASNTPRAVLGSGDTLGPQIVAEFGGDRLRKIECTKLAVLNDKLESIRESEDKVVVFTHWTNYGLHLIKDQLAVPHLAHWGVGQTDKESAAAIDRFKADPDITCLLSSDAGSHGLNLQEARYVIQYDPLYSYDDTMQRASRIDRVDSHLDGLTNYVMICEGTVEERVWERCQERRKTSAAIQGTNEVLSYSPKGGSEASDYDYLIFGKG